MTEGRHRRFYILLDDWTWWAWTLTAILLTIGLLGQPAAFVAAMVVTVVQCMVMVGREKSVLAFAVQLRIAYLLLLMICFVPEMRWLYWLPTVGTFALVIFGYCLMARVLSLLPWNRQEALSAALIRRTFLSRPDLSRLPRASGDLGLRRRDCVRSMLRLPGVPLMLSSALWPHWIKETPFTMKTMQQVQEEDRHRMAEVNQTFYERFWANSHFYGPEHFNTWEVLSELSTHRTTAS